MPETEARPREPKTATVERREASVPRHGTQGASQAPGVPVEDARERAYGHAQRVLSAAPERFSALRPPLDSGRVKQSCKPRARKTRRGNESGCLKSE